MTPDSRNPKIRNPETRSTRLGTQGSSSTSSSICALRLPLRSGSGGAGFLVGFSEEEAAEEDGINVAKDKAASASATFAASSSAASLGGRLLNNIGGFPKKYNNTRMLG